MTEGPQRPPDPDYKAMEPGDMLEALADDAHKWATAYCQFNPEANHCLMTTWFANAIETACDHRMWRLAGQLTTRFPEVRNATPEIRP